MIGPDPSLGAPGRQAAELFRRLRSWNVSSWRHGDRVGVTRATVARLAAMASEQDGCDRPPVPDVGVHALADQLEVLTIDAMQAGVASDRIDSVVGELARSLGLPSR